MESATSLCYHHRQVNLPGTLRYEGGHLVCDQVPLAKLAEQYGTPCYVYSESSVRANYRSFQSVFRSVEAEICYAVKANSNQAILGILQQEGSGFDVVSGGELFRLRQIGADPARVIFSGVGKTNQELEAALDYSIGCLNVESVQELEAVCRLAESRRQPTRVSFRFNPDIDAETHPYIATGLRQHKFGIDVSLADEVARLVRLHPIVQAIGVGCHIGSQILQVSPFIQAFRRLRRLAEGFRSQGLPIEQLDLGGGFGVPYLGEECPPLSPLAEALAAERGDYRILFEPGRRIVAEAGVLLTRVLYRKESSGKQFVIVDGAMNDLMRPSLYQAHHEIVPVGQSRPAIQADIVGPVCESGDFFARGRQVADLQPGDLAAVLHVGAYGFALSSNYNSRLRPPEVLVSGSQTRLIRRRDCWHDLVAHEEEAEGRMEPVRGSQLGVGGLRSRD